MSSAAILSGGIKLSDYSAFFDLYSKSRRIVVLTGAGVSTLSGIPDFRSSGGLYSKEFGNMSVEEILEIGFFRLHPDVFYSWARDNWYQMDSYEPNIIHRTLAEMERRGRLTEGIFTQNIDNLHQRAGSKKVYELHGSVRFGYCMECHRQYGYDEIARSVNAGAVPVCASCGGVIKPDIVFYGEPLDSSMLMRAENAFANADLAIVLGSSLVVNPAASLPYISARNGKDIVIVNRQRTYIDDYAAIRYDDLEEFFSAFSDYLVSHEGK